MSLRGGPPQRLTTDEVALVLRRAAELEAASTGTDPTTGFEATVVVDAAEEVGLSPVAVHQALVELQTGALPALQPTPSRRALLAGPSSVVESRAVARPPDDVLAVVDQYFRRRAFEQRRRQGLWLLYRERRDLLRHVRRIVDVDGARQLVGVSAVVVTVSPMAEARAAGSGEQHAGARAAGSGEYAGSTARTMVRLEATLEPGWRGIPTTATAYGVLAVTGTIAVATGDAAALVVGAPVGAAIGAAGWGRRRRWRHRRSDEIGETLAALLDRLD